MIKLESVSFLTAPINMPSQFKGSGIEYDPSCQCVYIGNIIVPVSNVRSMVRLKVAIAETPSPDFKWSKDASEVSRAAPVKSKKK